MPDTVLPVRETLAPPELLDRLVPEVEKVFHGKQEVVQLAIASLLARGHLLFDAVQHRWNKWVLDYSAQTRGACSTSSAPGRRRGWAALLRSPGAGAGGWLGCWPRWSSPC
jgi:hypothetical protein